MKLLTNDGFVFNTDIMNEISGTLKDMITLTSSTDDVIPIEVDATTLKMVICWVEKHIHDDAASNHLIGFWDFQFFHELEKSNSQIFDIMKAANYLNIEPLLNLCCKVIASKLKGKSEIEMREMFSLANV